MLAKELTHKTFQLTGTSAALIRSKPQIPHTDSRSCFHLNEGIKAGVTANLKCQDPLRSDQAWCAGAHL